MINRYVPGGQLKISEQFIVFANTAKRLGHKNPRSIRKMPFRIPSKWLANPSGDWQVEEQQVRSIIPGENGICRV